jgi:hypothetical protein
MFLRPSAAFIASEEAAAEGAAPAAASSVAEHFS